MPKTILIIDDDEVQLNFLQTLLADAGYTVLSTADGPQGLTICRTRNPELVVLDLGLPSVNGLELLREMRSSGSRARVIVLTGHKSEEARRVAARYGAADYIVKPVRPAALLQRIRDVINERSSEGQPAHPES